MTQKQRPMGQHLGAKLVDGYRRQISGIWTRALSTWLNPADGMARMAVTASVNATTGETSEGTWGAGAKGWGGPEG